MKFSPDDIYSMSKMITVAAALTLVEDGLVSLDDPIAKYMPQFAHMNVGVATANPAGGDSNVMQLVPARRPITVQDLMRHSSGITYGFFGDTLVKKAYQGVDLVSGKFTNADLVDRLAKLPLRSRLQPYRENGRGLASGAPDGDATDMPQRKYHKGRYVAVLMPKGSR